MKKKSAVFLIFLFLTILYLYRLGTNPPAVFCDEALIGLRAGELIRGNFSNFYNPFFYKHFKYVLGNFPVYSNAIFVSILGLNEVSIRLSSVFFAISSLILLYKILRIMKTSYPLFSVIFFGLTPLYYHIVRTNFGHMSSLFFIFLGYYFYLKAQEKQGFLYSCLAGGAIAIASYGYAGFILASAIFIIALGFKDLIHAHKNAKLIKRTFFMFLFFLIFLLPVVHGALKNPDFLNRFRDKTGKNQSFISHEKIYKMVKNYPKYYSLNYLFIKGENGIPHAFITRHSVPGNGIFFKLALPILIVSFLALFSKSSKNKIEYLPFFILFFIYPLPDLMTTNDNAAPYSYTVFSTIMFLPFLISFGLNFIKRKWPKLIYIIIFLFIFESLQFLNNYKNYPLVSADYWGWQYGPKEIVSYFSDKHVEYDELFMTGNFNEPDALLKFYDPENKCSNCFIGGLDRINTEKKQLFAMTIDEYRKAPEYKKDIKKIIYYPDNKAAFYIVEFLR